MNNNPQFTQDFAGLELLIGPMFAGKTTELLRKLCIYKEMGLRCCYVNSQHDSRSTTAFSTHNKLLQQSNIFDQSTGITSLKVYNIVEIIPMMNDFDVFAIDEAQLFMNLLSTCNQLVDDNNKRVIVAGLNGDSDRIPFGEIIHLIPFANTIKKLEPFCQLCAKNSKISTAIFTKCIVDKTDTILIGGTDVYAAVCRSCYNDSAVPPSISTLDSPPSYSSPEPEPKTHRARTPSSRPKPSWACPCLKSPRVRRLSRRIRPVNEHSE